MLFLRSILFNVFFYVNITLWMLVVLPLLFVPQGAMWWVLLNWSRVNLLALKWLAGTDVELRGLEHLPSTPVILAAKHQSVFETISLLHLFQRPAYILKQELMRIPVFGWFARKMEMIPVDRSAGQKALRAMVDRAHEVLADGRQIIIFPEGTRRPPGAKPAYRHGIVRLYKELDVPIVPVALNSGLYWPRKGLMRFPGKIIVEFLPMIEVGLEGEVAFGRLTQTIEQASDRLLLEAARSVAPPPLSIEAMQRVAELTQL